MSVTKYSALSAKIHAMRARLLTRMDYERLASKDTLAQMLEELMKHAAFEKALANAFSTRIARDSAERLLNLAVYGDYERIYSFLDADDKKTMSVFFRKIELTFIKTIFKTFLDSEAPSADLGEFERFFDKHTELDLKKLNTCSSVDDIIRVLPERYANILRNALPAEMTIFDIDLRLDLRYFTLLWKNTREFGSAIYGRQIDMLNLIWLYRTKSFFSVSAQEAFSYIIPVYYRLSKEQIAALVNAPDKESYIYAVNTTRYAGFFDDLRSGDEIITKYWNTMYDINVKNARYNNFSISAALSYMFFKEVEVRNLISVIEGIHYKVGKDAIMTKITLGTKEGGRKWR
ncbi:MAG: V-type ATPase subunit [Clostridia bacterium]|nr:V-type ATPase subunit [Clostridia bacterium]